MIDFYRTMWADSNAVQRIAIIYATTVLGLFASLVVFTVLTVPVLRFLVIFGCLILSVIGSFIYITDKYDTYKFRKSFLSKIKEKHH